MQQRKPVYDASNPFTDILRCNRASYNHYTSETWHLRPRPFRIRHIWDGKPACAPNHRMLPMVKHQCSLLHATSAVHACWKWSELMLVVDCTSAGSLAHLRESVQTHPQEHHHLGCLRRCLSKAPPDHHCCGTVRFRIHCSQITKRSQHLRTAPISSGQRFCCCGTCRKSA